VKLTDGEYKETCFGQLNKDDLVRVVS